LLVRWEDRRLPREFRIVRSTRRRRRISSSTAALRRGSFPARRRLRYWRKQARACLRFRLRPCPTANCTLLTSCNGVLPWNAVGEHAECARSVRGDARGKPALRDTGERVSDRMSGLFCSVSLWEAGGSPIASVTQLSTGANSHYNGLQLTGDKRLGHGVQVELNYTWSRCMDTVFEWRISSVCVGGDSGATAGRTRASVWSVRL